MPNPSYHCPHCDRLIVHRPNLAGAKVQCSSCGGYYFEPTDPLPGVKPVKVDEDQSDAAPMASLVKAPVLSPANGGDLPARDLPEASDLRSSRVLRPYELAGQKAVVISWAPESPTDAKVGTTKNLPKDEGNEMILRVALKLIKRKWPEIYPLLSIRLDKSFSDID